MFLWRASVQLERPCQVSARCGHLSQIALGCVDPILKQRDWGFPSLLMETDLVDGSIPREDSCTGPALELGYYLLFALW